MCTHPKGGLVTFERFLVVLTVSKAFCWEYAGFHLGGGGGGHWPPLENL